MADMEQLLTVEQTLTRLSICRTTLFHEINDGQLPVCKIRGSVRFTEKDINTYIESKRIFKKKAQICPLEKKVIGGASVFKRAAKGSNEVLRRMLQNPKHSNMKEE